MPTTDTLINTELIYDPTMQRFSVLLTEDCRHGSAGTMFPLSQQAQEEIAEALGTGDRFCIGEFLTRTTSEDGDESREITTFMLFFWDPECRKWYPDGTYWLNKQMRNAFSSRRRERPL